MSDVQQATRPAWRITEVWQKAIYIGVGYAVSALFFLVLRTWIVPENSWLYVAPVLLITLGYTLVGVRIFRGYREPVAAPRPWWRWTGRPPVGYWLGIGQLVGIAGLVPNLWPRDGSTVLVPLTVGELVVSAIITFGYLNSSFRLRANPEVWSQLRPRRGRSHNEKGPDSSR